MQLPSCNLSLCFGLKNFANPAKNVILICNHISLTLGIALGFSCNLRFFSHHSIGPSIGVENLTFCLMRKTQPQSSIDVITLEEFMSYATTS